jgi:flagellar biosynthetic protein FlhB
LSAEDRTEAATPKKRGDMRNKGQVAKSSDLSSMIVLIGIILAIHSFGSRIGGELQRYMHSSIASLHLASIDPGSLHSVGSNAGALLFKVVGPIMLVAAVLGVTSNVLQTGLIIAPSRLKPDFTRLNPLNGFKRYLSASGLFETGKQMLKLFLIGYVAYGILRDRYPDLVLTIRMDPGNACAVVGDVIYRMAIRITGWLLAISGLDYAYQRYSFEKSIRMTKEEVKQEHKQADGNPQVKGQIRKKMRQAAQKRMMKDVPTADVIVTNPTHFAVALKYQANSMRAPIVVAKGADLIAKRIRELATEHNVPIVENPPLARTLYKRVEIGEDIPGDLYAAVAEVLAYVYSLNQRVGARI